ncbi:hypothetical protein CDAR_230571 [Caerostris darwini]|uniref:Uncharacterized protein n=1 Tax=Caerostris darwini TaxID=1538125 RepID=A0AAV4SHR6_9ARAC|nr:hypothetical protein CDAR_230571 [Caerostris darwini]
MECRDEAAKQAMARQMCSLAWSECVSAHLSRTVRPNHGALEEHAPRAGGAAKESLHFARATRMKKRGRPYGRVASARYHRFRG